MRKFVGPLIFGLLLVALFATAAYAGYERDQRAQYQRGLANSYQETFYEMVDQVKEVENMLSKLRLTSKSTQSVAMFAQLWDKAANAQQNLARLPYNHSVIASTLNFLSQTSDFSFSMMNKNIDGKDLNDEDWEKIEQLYDYSKRFSEELNAIASEVVMGNNIAWDKIGAQEAAVEQADEQGQQQPLGSMNNVNTQFQEYPSLIYDGPFSAHIKTMQPLMTKDKPKITKEQGIEIVRKFLRYENIVDIKFVSETDTSLEAPLPIYAYQVVLDNNSEPVIYIEISQKGGLPVMMINYSDVVDSDKTISLEEAQKKAKEFLEYNGYKNMNPSYYENAGENAIINFAPVENGITMYPDLIKIKVDMRNGAIIGFEGLGYIMMHQDRKIDEPKLTQDEARKEISTRFNTESVKKCIIPLESKQEQFCYEFKGKYGEDSFLIYINTNTGKQEKILQLLISDNAILTQ